MSAEIVWPKPAPIADALGKYRIIATLGQGGMGTVYLALAGGLGEFQKLFVVKELRQDLSRRRDLVQMFVDEANLAARLDHPNIVQTVEASSFGDRYYLAMEYLDGQPLSALLKRQASLLPLEMRVYILAEVLRGLHYAHELRDFEGNPLHVVHRDVSPQNVFITYHGQVKIVDFGVAKAATANTQTSPGVFKGKLGYASPEQATGHPVDRRTDVFAVGVMLWEAITGGRFTRQPMTADCLEARIRGREPRIADLGMGIDPVLAHACDRALSVLPSARYPTAKLMASALWEYLEQTGRGVSASDLGLRVAAAFRRERELTRQVIKTEARRVLSESRVKALPSLASPEVSDDAPTTVADLSELVESSRGEISRPVQVIDSSRPAPAPPPTGKRVAWLVAASAGFALLLGAASIFTSRAQQPATATRSGFSVRGTTADTPPPRPNEPAVETDREVPAADPEYSREAQSSKRPLLPNNTQVRSEPPRRGGHRAKARRIARSPLTEPQPPAEKTTATHESAATAPASANPLVDQRPAPAVSSSAENAPAPSGRRPAATAPTAGSDLRVLVGSSPSSIDTENPYR